jgi:hypothetical protein
MGQLHHVHLYFTVRKLLSFPAVCLCWMAPGIGSAAVLAPGMGWAAELAPGIGWAAELGFTLGSNMRNFSTEHCVQRIL